MEDSTKTPSTAPDIDPDADADVVEGADVGIVRSLARDPEHAAERLVVYAVSRQAEPAAAWAAAVRAADPDVDPDVRSEELRVAVARFARVRGAIAGTPFFIALVPAYVSVLWDQAQMVLRIAALHGRDPRDPRMAAELLALRGVHPTVDRSAEVLAEIEARPEPRGRPKLGIRMWVALVIQILVLAGFVQRDEEGTEKQQSSRFVAVLRTAVGIVIWAMTWIVPVTFMVLMSWTCESDTRRLGSRAIAFYGETPEQRASAGVLSKLKLRPEENSGRRNAIRIVVLIVSIAIPLVFVAWTVVVAPEGTEWVRIIGAGVAVVLLAALALVGRRSSARVA